MQRECDKWKRDAFEVYGLCHEFNKNLFAVNKSARAVVEKVNSMGFSPDFRESEMVKSARMMNPLPNVQRDLVTSFDVKNLQIHLPGCANEVLQEKS